MHWHPFYFIYLFLWILVSLWPAFIAKRKGYSFILFYLLSLFFWYITFFVAIIIKDKDTPITPAAA